MKHYKIKTLFLITAVTLPLIFAVRVKAASYYFSPNGGNFFSECVSSLNVIADATGQSSSAADVEINFNPAQIEVLDSDPGTPGIQILEGDAYETYFYNSVDNSNGIIKLAAGSFNSVLTQAKVLGVIEFKSKAFISSSNISFKFTSVGNTLDSNIADSATNLDLLTSVTNAALSFTPGVACSPDIIPPEIVFVSPLPGAVDAQNLIFQIEIKDSGTGVNINSVEIIIDGETYFFNSPGVTYVGNQSSYIFTITPQTEIDISKELIVTVKAKDNAGNLKIVNQTYTFLEEATCPVSYFVSQVEITNECQNRTIIQSVEIKKSLNILDDTWLGQGSIGQIFKTVGLSLISLILLLLPIIIRVLISRVKTKNLIIVTVKMLTYCFFILGFILASLNFVFYPEILIIIIFAAYFAVVLNDYRSLQKADR